VKRKSVSSTLAGLIVIGIALASVFTIYALYVGGVFFVSKTNQQTLFLEYKSQEHLALVVSGSNLTVRNEWAHPSTIVDLLEIDPSNDLHTVPVDVEILPKQNYTFVNLLHSGWKYAVLTFYGNEFWAPYGMTNPVNEMFTLTMSVYPSNSGQTTPAVSTYVLPYGTIVSINQTPNGNNEFLYWGGSGYQSYSGTSSSATVYMWDNITETAYYGYEITFSVTGMNSNEEGTVLTVNGNSYTYSQLPVTVLIASGQSVSYSFYSPISTTTNGERYVWFSTSGLNTAQSATFTPTQSGSITGNYETQFELVMNVYPSGAGTTTPSGSSWYNAGTSVQISATPNSGYTFTSWIGSGSSSYSGSSNPVTITMNSPVDETAIFDIQVTVENTFGGSASASYNGQTYYSNTSFFVPYGSQVTFTASANQGYFFSSWAGSQTSTSNPLTLTITSPTSETAEFGFYITFGVSGMNSSAQETVITLDGDPYAYYQLPATIAVNYGQSVSYSFSSPVSTSLSDLKYVWVSTSGLDNKQSDTFTPTQAGNVIGNYESEYIYYINQQGIPSNGPDWSVSVNGQTYTETPTSTITIITTAYGLPWTAYNTSSNGVIYYASPNTGTAYPGTTTINYKSEITATGVVNGFVFVLGPKFSAL
jgi:hypothetical protein